MSLPANLVTIHPYFHLHPGKETEAESVMAAFVARTASERDCLFYEFTKTGDRVFCREGYAGGEAVLHHLQNVDAVLKQMLEISDLTRLEFHGPSAEIAKLRDPLAALSPDFYELTAGIPRNS